MNPFNENEHLTSINNNYSHEIRDISKKNRNMSIEISLIRNRINKLKEDEKNFYKKLITIREFEKKDQRIQKDKIKLQKELAMIKKQQMKELNKKKQKIMEQKIKFEKKRKKSEQENKLAKKTEYKIALNNKYLNKHIKEQMIHQQKNINNFLHEKVKQQYNESMSNKVRSEIMRKNKLKLQYEQNILHLKKLEKEFQNERDELSRMEKRYQANKTIHKNFIYLKYYKINYPKLNIITRPNTNFGNISEENFLANSNSHYDILSSNSAILSKNRKNKKCASFGDISNNTLVEYSDNFCTENKKNNNKENNNRNGVFMSAKIKNKNKSVTSLEIGDRQKRNSVKRYNINRKIAYSKKVRNFNKISIQ